MSNTPLKEELIARLIADYGFRQREAEGGPKLYAGRCPSCGEPEAYTPPGNPWIILCPRGNNCGERTYTKNIYPELQQQFAQRHPTNSKNPNATAEAYLRSRGFEPDRFKDWFTQGSTTAPADPKGKKYPTVKFTLSNGVDYHRLIDYQGKDKNKIVAAFQGHYWTPPADKSKEWGDTIWITEGVLDALSLVQAGRAAVACLSSGHIPTVLLEKLAGTKVKLIIAQDSDDAGRKSARKLAEACSERGIAHELAFPPENADWNDLLVRGDLSPEKSEETLQKALWRGRLFLAPSASEYHHVLTERIKNAGLFEYRGETWIMPPARGDDTPQPARVADFTVRRKYRLCVPIDSEKADYSEVLQVVHRTGERHTVTVSGTQMGKVASFREVMFSRASVQWDGEYRDYNKLLRRIRDTKVPHVNQVVTWGYDPASNSYYFADGAYAPNGRYTPLNGSGFVKIGTSNYKLPLVVAGDELRWRAPVGKLDLPEVIDRLSQAWPGGQSLAALGFYTASLFACQVAEDLRFFPILSLYGDSATGKSTLLGLLNRMCGRDWDGISMSQANTKAAISRALTWYSNFPLPLLEADAHQDMDLSEYVNLRTIYDRLPVRMMGMKTMDSSVRELPFRAALIMAWNDEHITDLKVRQRMASIKFLRNDLNHGSNQAKSALENIDPSAMACFRDMVLQARIPILARIREKIPDYTRYIQGGGGVTLERTAKNHAVILAGLDALLNQFYPDEAKRDRLLDHACNAVQQAAQAKERQLATDPDNVQHFFQQLETIMGDRVRNLINDTERIAIYMPEVEAEMAERKMRREVTWRELRASVHYIRQYPHSHPRLDKRVKAWEFHASALAAPLQQDMEV